MKNKITKSGLDKIESSPLDYWWNYLNPNKPQYEADEKTTFDEALRCAIFNPAEFNKKYVNMPAINRKTNIGKAEYSIILNSVAENNQILLESSSRYPDKFNNILKMKAEADKHPLLKLVFAKGTAEKYVEFLEEQSGALISFKSHWVDENNDIIVHLSSVSDASEEQFSKDSVHFRNHKRAAIQIDGFANINEPKQAFLFVNIEREAPYKISCLYLDERAIGAGRSIYLDNCALFMECLKADKWPGLKEKAVPVSLPEWYFKNR